MSVESSIYDEFQARCIDNKYQKWYWRLIQRARGRRWTKKTAPVYVESHHAIPKAIIKNESSRVLLSAREHIICHMLLTKFTEGRDKDGQLLALMYMMSKNELKRTRLYEALKVQCSTVQSRRLRGKPKTLETRQRMKEYQQNAPRFACEHCGKTSTAGGFKRYHGDNCLSNPSITPEQISSRANPLKGQPKKSSISDETRAKMSERAKRRERKECFKCGGFFTPTMLARWHGDNCLRR